MLFIPLKLRLSAGVVDRTRKLLQPLRHLPAVDGHHAQALDAAPQLAGVLGGDDDASRHHSDLQLNSVDKSCLFQPLAT